MRITSTAMQPGSPWLHIGNSPPPETLRLRVAVQLVKPTRAHLGAHVTEPLSPEAQARATREKGLSGGRDGGVRVGMRKCAEITSCSTCLRRPDRTGQFVHPRTSGVPMTRSSMGQTVSPAASGSCFHLPENLANVTIAYTLTGRWGGWGANRNRRRNLAPARIVVGSDEFAVWSIFHHPWRKHSRSLCRPGSARPRRSCHMAGHGEDKRQHRQHNSSDDSGCSRYVIHAVDRSLNQAGRCQGHGHRQPDSGCVPS